MPNRIQETCYKLGIECIQIPHEHHRNQGFDASSRHRDTLNIIMKYIEKYPGKYWLIDSDMWPITDITSEDFNRYFEKAGSFIFQSHNHLGKETIYAWPNIWWIDTRNVDISDLSWDFAPSCDTGGASHTCIEKHKPEIRWVSYYRSCLWSEDDIPVSVSSHSTLRTFLNNDPRNSQKYVHCNFSIHPTAITAMDKHPENIHKIGGWYWAELFDEKIIHIRAGSNWNGEGKQIHNVISDLVHKCFIDIL